MDPRHGILIIIALAVATPAFAQDLPLPRAARSALPDRDTGFDPLVDALPIVNIGDVKSPGGDCWGMSTFELWWFERGRKTDGEHLVEKVGTGGFERPSRVIAADTQAKIGELGAGVERSFRRATPEALNAALATRPQLAILDFGPGRVRHAVVVYGCRDGTFLVADPNVPRKETTLRFGPDGIEISSWGRVESITFGTFDAGPREDAAYRAILERALKRPAAPATIALDAAAPRSVPSTGGTVTFAGPRPPFVAVKVYVDDVPRATLPVDASGRFTLDVASIRRAIFDSGAISAHVTLVAATIANDDIGGYAGFADLGKFFGVSGRPTAGLVGEIPGR